MKKKILSLALALAMCLGLTVPAFADLSWYWESDPLTYESVTITAQAGRDSDDLVVYITYAGSGKLTAKHVDFVWESIFLACGVQGNSTITVGQGLTMTDEFKARWTELAKEQKNILYSVTFNDSTTPTQPEQPQQPAGSTASNGAQVSGWAKDRVNVALDNALAPDGLGNDYRVNITRAQFAATAVKLYEAMTGEFAEATGESSFTDTDDPVILLAADMGFVSGVGGGKFSPDALVTREQAAVMLSSVYTRLGGEIPAVEATTFADNGDVASWARNAVAFMNSKEIVTGVGNNSFSPKGNASIEQALLISLKMFETLK